MCVLLIDGDEGARADLRSLYSRTDVDVIEAASGVDGLRALYRATPDLVVLDDETPDLDSWQMLERIRQVTDVPLVMLGACDLEPTKVRALRAGADDYVTKPFGREELLARSEALLRRQRSTGDALHRYADSVIEVDFEAAEARACGQVLSLSPLEFRLLAVFVRNCNRVLSADQLLSQVWGDPGLTRDRVKIYVGYLRSKLRAAGAPETAIETLRGFGYRYRPPD
jgi:DNA-binding response OmpR family regulator